MPAANEAEHPPTSPPHPGMDLVRGLAAIYRSQLPSGEIPTFRRDAQDQLAYRLCPLMSALTHDALGPLDPTAPRFERAAAAGLPVGQRDSGLTAATLIRRRIRDFLAWQQQADGRWGFFGRGSGLRPDAATTACAAAVFLEGSAAPPSRSSKPPIDATPPPRWRRHVEALERYRSADGRYFTFVDRHHRGYSSLDDLGYRLAGFDRVVNAHVLRFLALVGEPVTALMGFLLDEVQEGDFTAGSPDHPNPLCFFHAVARAWRQPELPGIETLAETLIPAILARQTTAGDFDGPLSTALAILALLDLGCEDERVIDAGTALCRLAKTHGSWGYESYLRHGSGSATFTTAFCLAALGRLLAVFGDLRTD